MAKSSDPNENSEFSRTFRNLSRAEIADPDKLDTYESLGLGGQIGWDDLLESKRLLIVSAAGAGKTHECREQAQRLFASGKAAFFLTLEGVSTNDVRFLLDPAQYARYTQWLSDGFSEAHFFLDSADELLLSHGDFRLALRKLAYAINGQLHRARIVVTSRPIALDLDAFDETSVTFRYKDYRRDDGQQQSVMKLSADEFIRRFLAHVLPRGFHRIRHYGLLASATRTASIARARELLAVAPPPDTGLSDEPVDSRPPCPCCGGHMVIIETFERWCQPRAPPPQAHPTGSTIS